MKYKLKLETATDDRYDELDILKTQKNNLH